MEMDYRSIQNKTIELLLDYGMSKIPLDIELLMDNMDIIRIPYSSLPKRFQELCLKKTEEGFNIFDDRIEKFKIYFNDAKGKNRTKFTYGHEIKHIVDADTYEDEDIRTRANYFSRFLLVPIPLMIEMGIKDEFEIAEIFEVSPYVARYSLDFLKYHRHEYTVYTDNENELIKLCKEEIERCKDNLKDFRERFIIPNPEYFM